MSLKRLFNQLYAHDYSGIPALGRTQFSEIIQIDDRYLGLYCLVVLAFVILNSDDPHWNGPWAIGLWIAFTLLNLTISQISQRTQSFEIVEPIRMAIVIPLLAAIFHATGGAEGQFWYGFGIMIMGCSTVYLAIHLKNSFPLLSFPITYAILFFNDIDLTDRAMVGVGVAQSGFLALLCFFLVALMKFLLRHAAVLEEQRALLVQTSKLSSLGEMATGIAHEINNPLTIISGKAQLLKTAAARGTLSSEKVLADAEVINATATRISRIIRGLHSFAKEGDVIARERSSIQSIVADTLVFCEARFKHHNISLRVEMPEPELFLFCSPVQISQVILNLLNNAFDAVQMLSEKWVKLKVTNRGEQIEITVRDSGHGIDDSLRSRVMEPFFTTKEPGKGIRLGLSISKGIVESHQGELTIDPSSENTCFLLRLPIGEAP